MHNNAVRMSSKSKSKNLLTQVDEMLGNVSPSGGLMSPFMQYSIELKPLKLNLFMSSMLMHLLTTTSYIARCSSALKYCTNSKINCWKGNSLKHKFRLCYSFAHFRVHRKLFHEIFIGISSHFVEQVLARVDAEAALELVVPEVLLRVLWEIHDELIKLWFCVWLDVGIDDTVKSFRLINAHALLIVIEPINHWHSKVLTSCKIRMFL